MEVVSAGAGSPKSSVGDSAHACFTEHPLILLTGTGSQASALLHLAGQE